MMSKCADREHRCAVLQRDDPRYHIVRMIDRQQWDIWIPDFLRSNDTTVKAFVSRIRWCPFCGSDLYENENSKAI